MDAAVGGGGAVGVAKYDAVGIKNGVAKGDVVGVWTKVLCVDDADRTNAFLVAVVERLIHKTIFFQPLRVLH